jgi:hypothetical protein
MNNWAAILEEDLRWREAELASLKRISIVNSENEVIFRATLRASWAMLYAHYEGFTKFCWELLLDFVQIKNVSINDLNEKFRLLALEKAFRSLRGNLNSLSLWDFFHKELPELLKSNALFSDECRLDTESNLWPNVFEKECEKIGIKSTELENQRSRIKSLVSRRNEIAHGKKLTINSIDEYSEYENATMLVLHDLAIQVLEILEKESFMSTK